MNICNSTSKLDVFSGRVVFDHLAKTGGMAITSWLRDVLGEGCVTLNLVEDHICLIKKYGGIFSILCAHTYFRGEGLDPRYQYICMLREPVDRVISWLFYAQNTVEDTQENHDQKCAAEIFLQSNGEIISDLISDAISNYYIKHFSGIDCIPWRKVAVDQQLTQALSSIYKYDIVGVYTDMSQFVIDVAELVGIPAPASIKQINVTLSRPTVEKITPELRQRIIALNQLDIQFYNEVVAWKKSKPLQKFKTRTIFPMHKFNHPTGQEFATFEISKVFAALREGHVILQGQLLTFDVDFILNQRVQELEVGIHIFDENSCWAFGTNSTLKNKKFTHVTVGSYRVTHYVVANLPAGKYTAGFAFAELLAEGGQKELAWYDVLCEFQVCPVVHSTSIGYADLTAEMVLQPTNLADENLVVKTSVGSITPVTMPKNMQSDEQRWFEVKIENRGDQLWLGDVFRPVRLSYHWFDLANNCVEFNGLRTNLPDNGIKPGSSVDVLMEIKAPSKSGKYKLMLTLVQEMVCWFEERGFEPACLEVDVS